MRRYRYRAIRLFHIALWCVIIILSLNVLIKGINVLGKDSLNKVTNSFEKKIISTLCNNMIESNLPIAEYIADNDGTNSGFILNAMIDNFPINQYIAKASDGVGDNYIKEEENILLSSFGKDFFV